MQALAAASKTVDCLKILHHLQAYFLLVGDYDSEYTELLWLVFKALFYLAQQNAEDLLKFIVLTCIVVWCA